MGKETILSMWASYLAPTPPNVKKFMDSMLVGVLFIQSGATPIPDGWVNTITMVVIACKIFSNFISEKPIQPNDNFEGAKNL